MVLHRIRPAQHRNNDVNRLFFILRRLYFNSNRYVRLILDIMYKKSSTIKTIFMRTMQRKYRVIIENAIIDLEASHMKSPV